MRRFEETTIMVPAVHRETANAALELIGLGPDNFSIPVGPAAGPTITFYAANPRTLPKLRRKIGKSLSFVPGLIIVPVGLRTEIAFRGLVIKRSI